MFPTVNPSFDNVTLHGDMTLFDIEGVNDAGLELSIIDSPATTSVVKAWATLIKAKVCLGESLDLND